MITGKEYLAKTSVIGVQRIASKVLSLLYWIIITSIFTLQEIGIIAILAIVVNTSVPVTLLRVYSYAEYKISHSLGEKRWDVIHGTVVKTLGITLLLAVIIGLGLTFMAKPVVEILNISTEFILLIQLTGIAIIVSPFFKLGDSFLRGLLRGNAIAIMSFIQPLTLVISGFILFPFLRLIGLPIAWIISSSISFLTSIYFVRDVLKFPSKSPPLKEIFAFSLPLCGAGIIKFFSTRIDQFIVLVFLGIEALGLYFLVLEGVEILVYLSRTLLALFFPTMCEALEYGRSRAQLVLSRVFKFVSTLAFPLFVFSAIIGFPFFSLIFFGKIVGGQILFAILCLVFAFNSFRAILEFVLLADGYKNVPIQIAGISFIIRLIFLPVLLVISPTIDVIGVVYVVELFAITLFAFAYFKKQISISIPVFSLFKIISACGIAAILLFLLSTLTSGLRYLLVELGGAVIVYLAFISFLRAFDKDDFRFLKTVSPKILHPLIEFLAKLGKVY
ncbi:MAG: lipopolysaccharide biosynthesis protein [Promethearchaeota archaeon]